MVKFIQPTICNARSLPETEHDELGAVLLALSERQMEPEPLDDDTRAAIRCGLVEVQRGKLVSYADIEALWRKHGL